ncbi:hypothetical protein [Pontimicrobium sp. SW4]|uniref:DNA-directed DNA polymerase family A palm domain-containing protein n=1 Tax=Pontimicrobium sp. SW4 TaxID=3153519 RepID=A0AAU7BRX8_9FLAO
MKPNKPIILYLPEGFEQKLDLYLSLNPPKFSVQKEYFYYVIHHIISRKIIRSKSEFVALDKISLKTITVSNIDRYIKILKNGEFIISDGTYLSNTKSLWYKLNPNFLNDINPLEIAADSKLGKKIIKNIRNSKSHYNRLPYHLKLMKKEFMQLNFDYDGAYNWIQNNSSESSKLSHLLSVNQLQDKRFRYFKRNKTNYRLDTNLTNFKSELKQFIIGDYVSLDLRNSQPTLLGILLFNLFTPNLNTLCPHFERKNLVKTFGVMALKEISKLHQNNKKENMVNLNLYLSAALKGNLYDEFVELNNKTASRTEIKDVIFKVLFSQNKIYRNHEKIIPYEKEKKIFSSAYPFIYEIVKILKNKNHRNLSIYLQTIESYIFIDCISKRLVENGIIPLTIHDSVIIKSVHLNKARGIIEDMFLEQVGLVPAFKVEKTGALCN